MASSATSPARSADRRIRGARTGERRAMRLPSIASLLLATAFCPAQHRLYEAADAGGRAAAGTEFAALAATPGDLATTVALAALAGQGLPAGSAARVALDAALQAANGAAEPVAALASLRMALGELGETLTFRPLMQAELPAGFPGFTTVGEIELRHYPAYKMARTSMQGGSTNAFWPLFRHIESNGIAMTTPVQMDWNATSRDGATKPGTMAFLYGRMDIQPASIGERVEVVEVPACTVLSIGATGDDRREKVEALRDRLVAFVQASGGVWVEAGPIRTMGYNSPMVPRDRRCFEVQLPVRATDAVVR
jgi:hypothetical protein